MDFLGFDALQDLVDLKIDNLHQVGLGQLMEDNDVVEAIDELGFEDLLRFLEQLVAHRFVLVFAERFHRREAHRRLAL